jgi:hypothetical protein
MDIGAIEQRADSRHQHNIVGPHQFTHDEPLRKNGWMALRLVSTVRCPCRVTPQFLLL